MKKVLIFLVLVTLHFRATSQTFERRDTLAQVFEEVRSNYPELSGISVKLVFTEKKRHLMEARPSVRSIFKKEMQYKVFVSTNSLYQNFLDTLSVDAMAGWYAHELGHIVDYQEIGKIGVLKRGIQYIFFPKGRKMLEHRADDIAILHGYGCELLVSIKLDKSYLPKKKLRGIDQFYFSTKQLEERCRIYDNTHKQK